MLIRRRRQPRRRFSWVNLALEVFVVVLGVTLALGANELRQRFLDRRQVRAATESIAAELQHNCEQLMRAQTYHERLIEEVDSVRTADPALVEEGGMALVRTLPSWRGYNPAFVTAAAYETAQATGALGLMPYEWALGLGRYYTYVDLYQETVRQTLGAMMATGDPSFAQVEMALSITSDLQRELAPQSCSGARELGGASTEVTSDPTVAGS